MRIHPLSDCQTKDIGEKTSIWQFCVIFPRAKIGANCNISAHCLIENDVVIGDNVTVKSGVYIWDGTLIEDDVFIGPNVTFTNDYFPRSKRYPDAFARTVVRRGASIGGGATILPGIEIGKNAMVGAGTVVIESVPCDSVVVGNPMRIVRYLNNLDT